MEIIAVVLVFGTVLGLYVVAAVRHYRGRA